MIVKSDKEKQGDQLISRRQLLQQLGRYSIIVAGVLAASRLEAAGDDDIFLLLSGALRKKKKFYEDFETGNFGKYPWVGTTGLYNWSITTTQPYKGKYCAKSGLSTVYAGMISGLGIDLLVLKDSKISFYLKIVGGQAKLSYLTFKIDGVLKDYWETPSGWLPHTYEVSAGTHSFWWTAHKDGLHIDVFLDDISLTPKTTWSGNYSVWSGNTHINYGEWMGNVWSGDWNANYGEGWE